jgi:hypothetical protein
MHTAIKPSTTDTKWILPYVSAWNVHPKLVRKQLCFELLTGADHFNCLTNQVVSSFTDDDKEAKSLLCITEAIFVMFVSLLLSPFAHHSQSRDKRRTRSSSYTPLKRKWEHCAAVTGPETVATSTVPISLRLVQLSLSAVPSRLTRGHIGHAPS